MGGQEEQRQPEKSKKVAFGLCNLFRLPKVSKFDPKKEKLAVFK